MNGYDKTMQEDRLSNIIESIANQENSKSKPIELNDFYLPIKIQNDDEYEVKLHRKLDQYLEAIKGRELVDEEVYNRTKSNVEKVR